MTRDKAFAHLTASFGAALAEEIIEAIRRPATSTERSRERRKRQCNENVAATKTLHPKQNQREATKTLHASAGAMGGRGASAAGVATPQAPPSEAVREGKEVFACGAKESNRARELRDNRLRSGKFDRRDTYYEVDGVVFTFGDILDLNAKCRHIGNPAGMLMHMTESREWDTCAPWERKRFAISAVLRNDRQIGDKQTRPKAEIKQMSEREAIRAEVQAQWDKYHGPAH